MSLTLYTYPKHQASALKALVAAKYSGVNVVVEDNQKAPKALTDNSAALSQSYDFAWPVLATPEGPVLGSNAVTRYVASKNAQLLGSTLTEKGQVDSWVETASADYHVPVAAWVYPQIGLLSSSQQDIAVAQAATFKILDTLDKFLVTKTFLVGERLTLADIVVSITFLDLYRHALEAKFRSKYVNVTRWFLTCVNQPNFKSVLGEVTLATPQAAGAGLKPTVPRPTADTKSNAVELFEKIAAQNQHTNKYSDRLTLKKIYADDSGRGFIGKQIVISGWIQTLREQGGGRFSFVELSDGSIFTPLQVIVDSAVPGYEALMKGGATGASVWIKGDIVQSPGKGQSIEMKATEVELLGACDAAKYPLPKKKHTLEYLRSIAHLRPRTNTISAVARVRNALAFATHRFFQENGFLYVHTPLITAADCEGAGELFSVTTMLKTGLASDIPLKADKKSIDFSKDFFGKPSYLTVSGQLNAEIYACAMSSVYTFGPTFRAEDSHTYRHLAEFWMIEPEIAFADLQDNMNYAEAYLKYTLVYVIENCLEDLQFFEKNYEKGLLDRLKNVIDEPFGRLTYTDAVALLEEAIKKGHKFEIIPKWGEDLKSEHERYIAEQIYKKPIIVYNYPKGIKAFYMRLNEDQKTVAAMDVLVPNIGEIIGGSQREERIDVLEKRLVESDLPLEAYSWYLDLRRYGSVMHSGFGLGFERLVLFATGLENIRDAIPFPRWPGHAEY